MCSQCKQYTCYLAYENSLTHSLSYPKSRNAIASKNVNKVMDLLGCVPPWLLSDERLWCNSEVKKTKNGLYLGLREAAKYNLTLQEGGLLKSPQTKMAFSALFHVSDEK